MFFCVFLCVFFCVLVYIVIVEEYTWRFPYREHDGERGRAAGHVQIGEHFWEVLVPARRETQPAHTGHTQVDAWGNSKAWWLNFYIQGYTYNLEK